MGWLAAAVKASGGSGGGQLPIPFSFNGDKKGYTHPGSYSCWICGEWKEHDHWLDQVDFTEKEHDTKAM